MNIPRQEHPNPQFERDTWQNLNGAWDFEIDQGRSGYDRGMTKPEAKFSRTIMVPFCPQSKLSGVEEKDFMRGVWYRRPFSLTEQQCAERTVLHIGACDYVTTVYINGEEVGTHQGGYVSFCFDISKWVKPGKNTVIVYAEDDERDPMIPRGKQSESYFSGGCDYTRTTGIWQTVWLEFMPKAHVQSVKYDTDPLRGSVTMTLSTVGGGALAVSVSYDGTPMASYQTQSDGGRITFTLPLQEKHLWEVGNGRLYDVLLTYGVDKVHSYFGLRDVRMDGWKFLLNGKSVFQRLVLDQGFYPDGIYTAPTDAALQHDIEMSLACGFNGARLHQKIFEERFLYHCDRAGYLVWGEYPDWGMDISSKDNIYSILPEWIEEVKRDYNHPAIIGWCPRNETWDRNGRKQDDEAIRLLYRTTKAMDDTRPCIDTSGNYHVETDIFDVHDYDQDPASVKWHYGWLYEENKLFDHCDNRQHWRGEPVFVSEFGGARWSKDQSEAWGYGEAPKEEKEFLDRFRGLCEALLFNPCLFGFCYTQLTDIEQEQNGLYYFDRTPKFDPACFAEILKQKAAIEDSLN